MKHKYAVKVGEVHAVSDRPISAEERKEVLKLVRRLPGTTLFDGLAVELRAEKQ